MHFSGTTTSGDSLGRTLGFPTANILLENTDYEEGVFAVRGKLETQEFEGIAHFGPRPTLQKTEFRCEIHIFHFNMNIPKNTRITFETVGEKIRGIQKFSSLDDLKLQISEDVEVVEEILFKQNKKKC